MPNQFTVAASSMPERFWARVVRTPGCWSWTGSHTREGYSKFYDGSKPRIYAHRRMYELTRGPIPDGLTIDHLCRNTGCVNPDHLEAVSMRENILRGTNPSAIAARRTHCPHGHAYDEGNTLRTKQGHRHCRICTNARNRRSRAEQGDAGER